jgi:D-alanyl-D-alanine carboxypeptidase
VLRLDPEWFCPARIAWSPVHRPCLLATFGLLVAMILSLVVPATSAGADPSWLTQGLLAPKADILVDAATGRILISDNEHEAMRTASVAKIMTALVAVERLAPNASVTADAAAANVETDKIGFTEGTTWPRDEMLAALMMMSANDAAYSIAHTISGNLANFEPVLNETAHRLGLKDSVLNDPAGLDTANSFKGGPFMSAYDLAIATRNAMTVPAIAQWAAMPDYRFVDPQGNAHHFPSHNAFLPGRGYSYPGATGFKTGFTNRAGHSFVATATRNGRSLIAVVLGAADSGYAEAAALLDAGWAMPTDATGTGEVLPANAVSLYEGRALDQAAFASLGHAAPGAVGAIAPAAAPDGGAALNSPPKAPVTTPKPAVTTSKHSSHSGVLSLRNFLIVMILLLCATIWLRHRAVRRRRAMRDARRRQRMAAMRSGGLTVVDGRYRTGTRLGPPIESHVRVRRLDDPRDELATRLDDQLDALDA